jgi:hypothetical protein
MKYQSDRTGPCLLLHIIRLCAHDSAVLPAVIALRGLPPWRGARQSAPERDKLVVYPEFTPDPEVTGDIPTNTFIIR